jgi:gamma-glutamyltranspeptidase/glutathione hydrolase
MQLLAYALMASQAGYLKTGFGSADTVHSLAHAMALAFADRAEFLGDPDFVKIPLDRLLSPAYLQERWKGFELEKSKVGSILPSHFSKESKEGPSEPKHTTHYSVIDREGNAVAITLTVNANFGSGFVPPGTGVVMNDQMDDFSVQPGTPNLFGLVGNEANAIAPGKAPLSSMTPTMVRDQNGEVRVVLGASGGPRIVTAVFQTLMNRVRFGMSLPDAVSSPRFHHQWKPDVLDVEVWGFPFEVQKALERKGYALNFLSKAAKVHALERFPNQRVWGVADPRGEGAAVAE